MGALVFPPDFLWGAATSAFQIEGAAVEDGRGPSMWDAYAATPGRIADGSDARVACDHYHLWRDDLALMQWLGLGAYRFSIAWPRVLPSGRGAVNAAGLDFYDALVDALLAAGIEPFVTLYHWDLPLPLHEAGGWTARETAQAFAEYADVVTQRLGDRVRRWATLNEPWCSATLGYEEAAHAPGWRDPAAALAAAHHLLLGHGWAMQAIRRHVRDAEAGIVLIFAPAHAASESAADQDAARQADGAMQRWYLDPLFRAAYPADAIADRVRRGHLASDVLPFVQDGDLQTIAAPLDFLGVNYYSRVLVRAGANGAPEAVPQAPPEDLTDMGWEVYPDGLRETLERVHRDYAPPRIYITENGAAYTDAPAADGSIPDVRRRDYLHAHLDAAHAALAAGVPLGGYFAWSLLDNFEWSQGFAKRFGLFAVDYATQRRTARDSAHWYRRVVAAGAVDDDVPSFLMRRVP